MSPLIMVVIFFVAWRQSRRIGRAFTDTAAWCAGYLATYSGIVVLHLGRPGIVSLNPESLSSVIPIAGGFVAMKLSHWLWRRRGGHLEPVVHPFASKHWVRALRAMLFGGPKRPAAPARPAAPSAVRQASGTPSTPAVPTAPTAPATTTTVRPAATARTVSNRWVRVARAMLDTESSSRNRGSR